MAFSDPNLKWDYLESLKTWVPMIFSGAIQLAGVPAPLAEKLKEALEGFLNGTSIKDEKSYQLFQASWQLGLPGLLEAQKEPLAPYLVEMLETVFEPKAYLEILSAEDPEAALEQAMRLACLRDESASLWKLGEETIQQMAREILSASMEQIEGDPEFLRAVQDKHWFVRHFGRKPHTANADYALSFAAPLFLHKDSPDGWRVTLRNLYVMPRYTEKKRNSDDVQEAFCLMSKYTLPEQLIKNQKNTAQNNLEERLATFITGDAPFLLVEGDAGTGKTTLSAWLNYHYVLGDKPRLFVSRPLVTVRLRDLDSEILKKAGFNQALLDYTQCEKLDAWPKNAILLLDGYDELCMIEQSSADPVSFLKNLETFTRKGFRVVLTSRHTYIPEKLPFWAVRISLQHFDAGKRRQWMQKYTSSDCCGQILDAKVRTYIEGMDENTVSCVCDTPMTLYMLATGRNNEKYLENDWTLYHHIFMNALSETQYNEMIPNPTWDYQHHVSDLKEVLYRISEEIAFAMFKTSNAAFTLNDAELAAIVKRLKSDYPILQDTHMEQVARHCYGLCCYWKTGGQKGAVEFLHNTIRDFFLAEYLCRKLDETVNAMQESSEAECTRLTDTLARHLWYAELEPNVLYFVYHRVCWNKQQGAPDYASYEASDHKIKDILDDLSDEGILRNAGRFCKEENSKGEKGNLYRCTLNIVKNAMTLYRVAYEPYLKEGELINWCDWTRGKSDLVYTFFAEIFSQDPFCQYNSNHREKHGMLPFGLGSRGNFTGNRLQIRIDLQSMNLIKADLSGANLSDANLSGADLSGVNLHGTDLSKVDLRDVDLSDADLCGAKLCGANLPKGFKSHKQSEQIQHLKKLKIKGLKLDALGSSVVRQIQQEYDAKRLSKMNL